MAYGRVLWTVNLAFDVSLALYVALLLLGKRRRPRTSNVTPERTEAAALAGATAREQTGM